VRPVTGLAAAVRRVAGEARRPVLALERALRLMAWRRNAARYREMLGRDELIRVPEARPANVLFTVIVPVYRVRPDHVAAAVGSVLGQTHERLELVLVDDAAPSGAMEAALAAGAGDPRVRPVRLDRNRGIAAASDAGAREARGEWLVFLDHDDLLHPRTLEIAARALAGAPDAEWIFTDEDTIGPSGRPLRPLFKPGFSAHLLLAFNLVAHARMVRRELFERLGGHGRGIDGAQDWELALRALAGGTRFLHLPGVLYRWRRVPGSMSRGAGEKPSARVAAEAALERFADSIPGARAVAVRPAVGPVSLFDLRWSADPGLGFGVLGGSDGSLLRARGRAVLEDWDPERMVRAAERLREPFLLVAPRRRVPEHVAERLLARALVPGTALAAARGVRSGRVTASGWWGVEGGGVRDPWRGLRPGAAGVFNLAMVPGPRLLPPPTAWVVRREALLEAWDVGRGADPSWRLAVGWDRLGLEVVTVPGADLPCPVPGDPGRPQEGVPWREARWWKELGLV